MDYKSRTNGGRVFGYVGETKLSWKRWHKPNNKNFATKNKRGLTRRQQHKPEGQKARGPKCQNPKDSVADIWIRDANQKRTNNRLKVHCNL